MDTAPRAPTSFPLARRLQAVVSPSGLHSPGLLRCLRRGTHETCPHKPLPEQRKGGILTVSVSVQTTGAANLRPGRGEGHVTWGCCHWKRKQSSVAACSLKGCGCPPRGRGVSLTVRCFWRHRKRRRGRGGVSAALGWSEGPAADPTGVWGVRGGHRLEWARRVR